MIVVLKNQSRGVPMLARSFQTRATVAGAGGGGGEPMPMPPAHMGKLLAARCLTFRGMRGRQGRKGS